MLSIRQPLIKNLSLIKNLGSIVDILHIPNREKRKKTSILPYVLKNRLLFA